MNAQITTQTLLAVLSHHIGTRRGISVRDLAIAITGHGSEGEYRRIRICIEQLRRDGHHVCGHPATGYHMAASAEELDRTCRYLVDRAMTSLAQVAAMRRVSMPDLHGQLGIPHESPEPAPKEPSNAA